MYVEGVRGRTRHAHATRAWQTAAPSSNELTMNTRVALPLTAIVSFALTCGVLLWNRRDGEKASAQAEVEAPDLAPASAPLQTAPPALTPAGVGTESPALGSREMPIQFTMRALPATDSYFGAMVNTALNGLMVDVAIFSPQSQQTQTGRIRVEAGTRARFGMDDGLVIKAGDRITLRSGGYADLVTQLPTLEPDSGAEPNATP